MIQIFINKIADFKYFIEKYKIDNFYLDCEKISKDFGGINFYIVNVIKYMNL